VHRPGTAHTIQLITSGDGDTGDGGIVKVSWKEEHHEDCLADQRRAVRLSNRSFGCGMGMVAEK